MVIIGRLPYSHVMALTTNESRHVLVQIPYLIACGSRLLHEATRRTKYMHILITTSGILPKDSHTNVRLPA